MEKLGLKGKILALVKGLVIGSTAKIHINGLFSLPIPILRGVRQGDPLAPLLFAILTQPLLHWLDKALNQDNKLGIKIDDELTICHRLFADDVGIFIQAKPNAFQELREHLAIYKKASGARLNLQKSIMVPIACTGVPDWLRTTGCLIAEDDEPIKYLGAPFGSNLSPLTIRNFCLNKLSKSNNNLYATIHLTNRKNTNHKTSVNVDASIPFNVPKTT
jgi:hypothetical protein